MVLSLYTLAAQGSPGEPGTPPDLKAPGPRPVVTIYSTFNGTVTAIDQTSITVRCLTLMVGGGVGLNPEEHRADFFNHRCTFRGERLKVLFPDRMLVCKEAIVTREAATFTHHDGEVTIVRRADEPARKFTFAKELLAGGVRAKQVEYLSAPAHLPADVRVGDEVVVQCAMEGKTQVCGFVAIERRPSGRVPPAAFEARFENLPRYHERMNAHQDWENGLPLPDYIRRQYAQFFPEPDPVAPPPRELPPRVPPAVP